MKLAFAALLLSASCLAQTSRVPTVTRTVQLFGHLERKLATLDAQSKPQLLTDDFEERLCAEPGTPIARDTFLQQATASDAKLTQEAVHSYGDTAVYSGLRTQAQSSESIVDVWVQAAGTWKLSVRYRCPASGAKPAKSAVPKRY
jgi:hypothetical protein